MKDAFTLSRMRTSHGALPACLSMALLLLLGGQSAHGQEAGAAQPIEEIVVTARGREELIQDIPLSVTQFSSADIEAAGIRDLEDISLRTPGLQFNTQLSGFRTGRLFSNMRFRGVEGSEFSSLQTASLYMDGVFVLQGAQSLALADIERVEVIRGPQSARFGRNSFAGAVNYATTTPNMQEFTGRVAAEAAQYGRYEVSAGVEGPIIEDVLALRLAYSRRAGVRCSRRQTAVRSARSHRRRSSGPSTRSQWTI